MPEKINIASLSIDASDVIKESARLKKELDSLKDSQKELKKSGEGSSEAFVQNEIQIKKLSKSYRDNQEFAAALDQANEDLTKTMSVQGKSTQELRDSRSQLNKISKNIVGNTEEEIDLRNKLNQSIDDQTEALRNQSSEFNEQKDEIGEYKNGILEAVESLRKQKDVLTETQKALEANLNVLEEGTEEYEDYSNALVVVNGDLDKVNDSLNENEESFDASSLSLSGFIEQSQESGGAMKALTGGIKAGAKAMYGLIKSSLAFIATPVGIVLAAIAGAFLLIQSAMNRSEESTTKVKKAFSAFSGIVKGLLKFLEPLGEFLIDGLVKGFELVEKGLFKTLSAIQKGLKFLGLDDAAASLGNFTEGIEEAAEASKELTQAELEFAKAQRISRKLQLDYQKAAEKLRQIRDDESKSIPERIKANSELGALLQKQGEEELALAQKALNVANLKIKLNGETTESLDEQAEALTEIADIEERITGQVSEQLVNRVSLEKEAAEKVKEIKEAANEEAVELAKEKAEAAIELAQYELNEYIRANQSKLQSDKFLTEESLKEEQRRLDGLAEQRRLFAAKELEEGSISQIEYNNRIAEIDAENLAAKDELAAERKEALAEQAAIDAENRLELIALNGENELAVQTQVLENERKAEVQAAEKSGADVALINAKYKVKQEKLDKAVNDTKLALYSQAFGEISGLLGENTVAAKVAGLAQTAINTYLGVSQILAAPSILPEPAGSIAKGVSIAGVIATGLSSAAKISGISTKLSKGDVLKGKSHARGGIPFSIGRTLGFEAEDGEALINKKSTDIYRPLLSAINVAGGGKKFASGSVLGTASGTSSGSLIDYDILASRISEAYESLPPPVVSVTEIQEVGNNVAVVEDLATV